MSALLDNTSAQLFETTRTLFQVDCQQFIEDILHNRFSLDDELKDRVGELHLSLEQLKRAGWMMAIDSPTNELVRVVPIGYFSVLIDRPGQEPMSEFDWACIYTSDTLNMLTADFMRHRDPAELARNVETQSFLWDLGMPFPVTISHAEDTAPEPYVNAFRIPAAASMARMNSRIPVRPRPPPPVDTDVAYSRPVPGPYIVSEPASPTGDNTMGLH